jgi:hypothetical protein
MPAETSSKRPLTQLNLEIEQLEAEAARLEAERTTIVRDSRRGARQLSYLVLARWIRKPTSTFAMWPVALPLIGGGLIGFLLVIFVSIVTSSLAGALLAFLVGLGAGAAFLAHILHRPQNSILPTAIAESESQARLIDARLQEKTARITETKARLQKLIDERRDQVASGKLQRAALLQRNWKHMQGAEWEDFVVEVLRTHGATVDRALGTGMDSTLIADYGPQRVAVFTLGEGQVVNSATVGHALAAKDRLRCDSCAIVINRRFTGAAQDFARRNGCTAIGAGEFPDFVLGKIEI